MATLNGTDNGADFEARGWSESLWYVGGHGTYFLAMGMQSVVYPFLVTFILHMQPSWIGIASMFTMLPMFGLVLFGGMTADRAELRMHLIRLQLLAAMPMLALATFVLGDMLSYIWLVACGTATGCVSAFVMPARDSLLSRVAQRSPSGDLQQAVTVITGVQFGAQLIGILIAREAPWLSEHWGLWIGRTSPSVGAGFVLIGIVLSLGTAAFCTSNVRPAPPSVRARDRKPSEPAWRRNLRDIHEGLLEVRRSERMLPVVTLMFFGGLFLMGVFSVHLQVLVRDVYGKNIGDYSAIMMAFMVGVTTTTTILSQFAKRIVRQGRVMMLSFLGGAIVMSVVFFEPPLWVLYFLLFFWGCTAGISMSMSRSIVQEAARESHRARIMSVFQLGFLGGAPIGSLLMGLVTSALGPIHAALWPMCGIIVVWIGLFIFTDLWRLSRPQMAT